MSCFTCPKCETDIIDGPAGYVTGCDHYPIENKNMMTNKLTPLVRAAKCLDFRLMGPEAVIAISVMVEYAEAENKLLREQLAAAVKVIEHYGRKI